MKVYKRNKRFSENISKNILRRCCALTGTWAASDAHYKFLNGIIIYEGREFSYETGYSRVKTLYEWTETEVLL